MVQLQLNQGPQDALLYDNTRSYFTNVGYVRTSNFQIEYRDVDPQNTAQLGSTATFVIPKAADLLGAVDFICELAPTSTVSAHTQSYTSDSVGDTQTINSSAFSAWVDEIGFAMIDRVTFSVGSNKIEEITGDQLQITNELMRADENRLGSAHVLKTGRRPGTRANGEYDSVASGSTKFMLGHAYPKTSDGIASVDDLETNNSVAGGAVINLSEEYSEYSRLIEYQASATNSHEGTADTVITGKNIITGKKKLIVPLGLFFSQHPSQYFPLAAVAGCNDVRIEIKFRNKEELIQLYQGSNVTTAFRFPTFSDGGFVSATPKLRCHYVHVTGPEAQQLMNREHVRLLKLWHQPVVQVFKPELNKTQSFDLNFLHPVTTLIITLRCEQEVGNSGKTSDRGANAYKGFYNYHGDGRPTALGIQTGASSAALRAELEKISLTINGQERHPSLNDGIDTNYLKHRLMPMLHSNTGEFERQLNFALGGSDSAGGALRPAVMDLHSTLIRTGRETPASVGPLLEAMQGAKNIFVYPFSLAPEGTNPSGAVNFSKVSHAKLNLKFGAVSGWGTNFTMRCEVHALYYNWLQVKDGRAILSFQ